MLKLGKQIEEENARWEAALVAGDVGAMVKSQRRLRTLERTARNLGKARQDARCVTGGML